MVLLSSGHFRLMDTRHTRLGTAQLIQAEHAPSNFERVISKRPNRHSSCESNMLSRGDRPRCLPGGRRGSAGRWGQSARSVSGKGPSRRLEAAGPSLLAGAGQTTRKIISMFFKHVEVNASSVKLPTSHDLEQKSPVLGYDCTSSKHNQIN